MRRTAAIETTLALLLAFLLAPFQHVHADSDHEGHAHAGEVHAHFFLNHTHAETHLSGGIEIEDDDDDDHAHARSLDTFTLVLPTVAAMSLPSRAPAISIPAVRIVAPVEVIEERAHAPPALDTSTPRAPPL